MDIKKPVPHAGYSAGWNVVVYNDDVHSVGEVVTAFMNSNFFDEFQATQLTMIASQKGYLIIPFSTNKAHAEKLIDSLRKSELQCELIESEGLTLMTKEQHLCPNCKKQRIGAYCAVCGTKLIKITKE